MIDTVYVAALGYTWKIADLRAENYHPAHLTPVAQIVPVVSAADPTPVRIDLLRAHAGAQSVTLSVWGERTIFDAYEDMIVDPSELFAALENALSPYLDEHRVRQQQHLESEAAQRTPKLVSLARWFGLAA